MVGVVSSPKSFCIHLLQNRAGFFFWTRAAAIVDLNAYLRSKYAIERVKIRTKIVKVSIRPQSTCVDILPQTTVGLPPPKAVLKLRSAWRTCVLPQTTVGLAHSKYGRLGPQNLRRHSYSNYGRLGPNYGRPSRQPTFPTVGLAPARKQPITFLHRNSVPD
jgi:hypothetical protein